MALVVGGEVRVAPLLTRSLQRLLYHTSFPVGLAFLDVPAAAGGTIDARLELAIGDWKLTELAGRTLRLPAELLGGTAATLENPELLSALPSARKPYRFLLRLPIPGQGVILLLAPTEPHAELPLAHVFEPVMANLARAIVLCRAHEMQERALLAQRDAARRDVERFHASVETSADSIFVVDPATRRFVEVNSRAQAALGYGAEDWRGLTLDDVLTERSAQEFAEHVRSLVGPSFERTLEATCRRRDGTEFPVEARLKSFAPVGEPSLVIVAARDITLRKQAEEQARQSQKLETVARLAGGVAHDFNNLLTAILSGADALIGRLGDGDALREEAEEIQAAARRAATLTRQLLLFSRREKVNPAVLDVNEIVTGMGRMLGRLIGEDVELVVHAGEGLRRVKADPGAIEQVVVNLAVNSRDAMQRGGRLTLETANRVLGAEEAAHHPGAAPGPHVVLSVSDTGTGIEPSVLPHVFEPFFTTKEAGKGTGLGLSTVNGIVRQVGGHIRVDSAVGKGTTFEIWLPASDDAPEVVTEPVGAEAGGAAGTVLLVEDERSVRRPSVVALRDAGFTVIEAADAAAALEEAAAVGSGPIDVLVADVVMPRMGGEELAERLRALHPEAAVLLISGYTAGVDLGALGPRAAFLQKPFSGRALARKVRELQQAGRPARGE
jgi:PAS domain S-box-containing protein